MRYELDVQVEDFNLPQNGFSPTISKGKGDEPSSEYLDNLNQKFEESHPDEVLKWGFHKFGKDMVLGTGFGPSGIFLIHRAVSLHIPVTIFYLDTGLLFSETYKLRDELVDRFAIDIEPVRTPLSVEEQAKKYGDELWKKDPDRCCHIRKVLPLQNYLSDKKAWVTGVRRSQASTRKQTKIIEWDPANRVIKVNPLAGWTNQNVWDYIHEHNLPYNPLHDDGYPTIGCIPCTQPASPNGDERSGRWNNQEKTECGIHIPAQNFKNGK